MSKKLTDRLLSIAPWKLFLILLLFRLPYLIAYYPGMMIYDTGSSIAQFFGYKTHVVSISTNPDALLSNHHMILLTFLIGGAVKIGDMLGSQNFGFFLYTLTQVFITNAVVVHGLYVFRNKCHPIAYIAAVTGYAILPVFSLWQITISKDALFSAFALLLITLLYQLADSQGTILRSKKYLLFLIAANLMTILSKPQGVYISLITFLVMALVFRKSWFKLLCVGILPSLIYLTVFTGILLPALNVAVSGKQEMLGFAFQQTARCVRDHSTEITEDQKKTINAVLPYEELAELYTPDSQDPVKFSYKQTASDQALTDYLMTWAEMFFQYPKTYFAATIANIQHFFIPDTENPYSYCPVLLENSAILNEHSTFTLYNPKPQPLYSILAAGTDKLATTPVVSLFFQPCFYVWLTIISVVFLMFQKKHPSILALVPLILGTLILLIAPVVDIRYVLFSVYCVPMLPVMIFQRKDNHNHGRDRNSNSLL